jgi:hypothetical protein
LLTSPLSLYLALIWWKIIHTLSEGEAVEQREAMESLEKRLRRKANETSNLADNLDRLKTEEDRLRYLGTVGQDWICMRVVSLERS